MISSVVVWGSIKSIEVSYRLILPEVLKGHIKITAYIVNGGNHYTYWDGIPVCDIRDMGNIEYDYIINTNMEAPEQISKIIKLLKVEDRIIPLSVFYNPMFSFEKYIKLKNSRISIIASHCWGGFAYHQLGLRFESPFINLYLDNDEYLKMSNDFKKYISSELEYDSEVFDEYHKANYPVGRISDVRIYFEHYSNWNEARDIWTRRLDRINFDNLFFEMTCRSELEIERFLSIPYKNKVAFTDVNVRAPQVINISEEEVQYCNLGEYSGNLGWYMCDKLAGRSPWVVEYNLTELLLGETDYMRI